MLLTVFTVVILSQLVHSVDSIQSEEIINFVIFAQNKKSCSFALPATATLVDLKHIVTVKCGIQYPFEIQLLGETLVSSKPSANQMIGENSHIQSTRKMLMEMWNDPVGFQFPIKVKKIQVVPSKKDYEIYFSFFHLFGGPTANADKFEWYRFVRQCVESQSCFVQDLCDRFRRHFICEDGQLTEIRLIHQKLRGIIDLSSLPPTVTKLNVGRNFLTEMIGLDSLSGKRLQVLIIRKNPLEIDLQPLVRSAVSADNPLRVLWVMASQVSRYYYPEVQERIRNFASSVHRAAQNWIDSSILDRLLIGWDHCYKIQRSNTSEAHYDRWELTFKE